MGWEEGGGENVGGRLGFHYYSYALKYTNVIFLIVGMVVMDNFFRKNIEVPGSALL